LTLCRLGRRCRASVSRARLSLAAGGTPGSTCAAVADLAPGEIASFAARWTGRSTPIDRSGQPVQSLDDGVPFPGCDLSSRLVCRRQEIGRTVARLQHILDGRLDEVGFPLPRSNE